MNQPQAAPLPRPQQRNKWHLLLLVANIPMTWENQLLAYCSVHYTSCNSYRLGCMKFRLKKLHITKIQVSSRCWETGHKRCKYENLCTVFISCQHLRSSGKFCMKYFWWFLSELGEAIHHLEAYVQNRYVLERSYFLDADGSDWRTAACGMNWLNFPTAMPNRNNQNTEKFIPTWFVPAYAVTVVQYIFVINSACKTK